MNTTTESKIEKEYYFVRNKEFYKTMFRILIITAFQNLINYGVNMADNIMLGTYGQAELSGASVVNQIFFMLNACIYNVDAAFSVLAAQYWGQKRTDAINQLSGLVLKINAAISIAFFLAATIIPGQIIGIFTNDAAITAQALDYLSIIKYIFIPYAISSLIMDMLRNVETVNIAFYMSIVSLIINICLNFVLIFGYLGFPELGIKGAALATLAARLVEMIVLVLYLWKKDKKLCFFKCRFWVNDKALSSRYFKIAASIVPAGLLWAIATPIQTAFLGSLTADAIAANSVTSTYYQLLKVIAQAASSGAAVVIGKYVGAGDFKTAREGSRTIELIGLGIGLALGGALFLVKPLILGIYSLTPEAEQLTDAMLTVMCFVMVGMSYEHPILFGTLRAGGDAKFTSLINMVVMWCFSVPLAFAAFYWWNLGPLWVTIFIQSEQLVKCIPAFIRRRQYSKWMHIVAK